MSEMSEKNENLQDVPEETVVLSETAIMGSQPTQEWLKFWR